MDTFKKRKLEDAKMKKRLFVLMAVMIFVATVLALCACGKKTSSFKVEYVGTSNRLPAGLPLGGGGQSILKALEDNMFIRGEVDGKTKDIPIQNAFKGYKLTAVDYPDPEHIKMKGTESGGKLYYEDGVIVTIEDESGKSLEITIQENSVFDAETDGDTVYLLPPK